MSEQSQPDYQFLELSRDEPLRLSGPPQKIRGKFAILNNSDQRVRVRNARIRGLEQKAAKGARVLSEGHAIHPLVLRPGQTRQLRLSLALNPHTPPGEYQAELVFGDHTRPVSLNVVEQIELSIAPSRLVIANVAGSTSSWRVVFSNLGNVPLTIGEIGAVPLEDDLIVCRTLRAALKAVEEEREDPKKPVRRAASKAAREEPGDREKPDEETSLEKYVAEILHQAKINLDKAGNLRVHNKTGKVTIPPGGSNPIDLEIRLPDTLEKRTRYRGAAAIYTTQLNFVIVPTTE